jgi:hypothetical protein
MAKSELDSLAHENHHVIADKQNLPPKTSAGT